MYIYIHQVNCYFSIRVENCRAYCNILTILTVPVYPVEAGSMRILKITTVIVSIE